MRSAISPLARRRGGVASALLCALALLLSLLAAAPAQASGEDAALVAAGLVEPLKADGSLVLDIRYATPDNFTGRTVYPSARCYLRAEVARRLLDAQAALRAQGLGLKIFDCYRPFSVQEAFWKIMPDERYVLEPKRGEGGRIVKSSRHNRGAAVDVSLVDLKSGSELPMPTGYDDFSEKAHRGAPCADKSACANAVLLEKAMAAQGFEPLPTEWWHFDGPGWQRYEPADLPLPKQ